VSSGGGKGRTARTVVWDWLNSEEEAGNGPGQQRGRAAGRTARGGECLGWFWG